MLFAAVLMSIGVSLIPLSDTAGKGLMASGTAPIFVAWSRLALGAVIMQPFIKRAALRVILSDPRVWLRSLLQVLTISCILTALGTEPLADVFGAFFIGPILSYILSVWLLGERASLLRSILLALGFIGVLLVVQPAGGIRIGLLWAMAAGVFYGCFLTASRWLSDIAPPKVLLVSQLVIGGLVLAPFGLANLPTADQLHLELLAVSVLASLLGNLLIIFAYRTAAASRLAPFVYFQLLSAAVLGWLVFGTWPDPLAQMGLVLIAGSGLATLAIKRDAG